MRELIEQLREADIFKPATKKDLKARELAAQKARDERYKDWIVAHKGKKPDTCPHCGKDLRAVGVYGDETTWGTMSKYWTGSEWEWGDTNTNDSEITAWHCEACDGELQEGEDFNHEDLQESKIEEKDVFKPASKEEVTKRNADYQEQIKKQGGMPYYVDFSSWELRATDIRHAEARAMELMAQGKRPEIIEVSEADVEYDNRPDDVETEPLPDPLPKPEPATEEMKIYYIDFSSWVIKALGTREALEKAIDLMHETITNGSVPAISSIEPGGSNTPNRERIDVMEAGKKEKNVFKPASQEEVKKRRSDYDKEMLAKAEDWVGVTKRELEAALEVETSIEDDNGNYITLSALPGQKGNNGESEWMIFPNAESAEEFALERVKDDLENQPESFSPYWLQTFITIDDTTRRIMAGEESDHYVDEQMEDDEILEAANVKDEYDSLQDAIDELDTEAEDYDAQEEALVAQQEKILEDAKETVREEKYEEIYEALDDPIQYFVNDQGMYSMEDLFKANFVSIDYDEAAQDAIDADGASHFLDYYDGSEVELPSGAVAFGTN